jgi:hypothetical protein
MLQNDSICHKNASRVHQTSIVEHLTNNNFFPKKPHVKKTVDLPLSTQKLWRTLISHGTGTFMCDIREDFMQIMQIRSLDPKIAKLARDNPLYLHCCELQLLLGEFSPQL